MLRKVLRVDYLLGKQFLNLRLFEKKINSKFIVADKQNFFPFEHILLYRFIL